MTGASGRIGRCAARVLEERGHEVLAANRHSVDIGTSHGNVVFDLRDREACLTAVSSMDAVVHLAAVVSVAESIESPGRTLEVNVTGTANMLDACRRADVEKFIFPSTQAVYGNNFGSTEDDEGAISPLTPYAFSKYQAEEIVRFFEQAYDIHSTIFRISNTYTDEPPSRGIMGEIVRKAGKATRVMEIQRDVSRDFIHASDVARAITEVVGEDILGTFNIGTGRETKLSELVEIAAEQLRKRIDVRVTGQASRPLRLERWRERAEIQAFVGASRWRPEVALEDGVKGLISEIRDLPVDTVDRVGGGGGGGE